MKDLRAYRVRVPAFLTMARAGAFGDDRVELLGGILTMMTSGPGHDYAVTSLGDRLDDLLPRDRWTVREEKPVTLGLFWMPVPDLAVVRGPKEDYKKRTPDRRDIALIVEVADTTYAKDTGKKLRRYRRCRVPAYWVVDLARRRVEVRDLSGPDPSPPVVFGEDDEIPLQLDGHDHGRVAVSDLLI
jgi:Uma2 family endonuclease